MTRDCLDCGRLMSWSAVGSIPAHSRCCAMSVSLPTANKQRMLQHFGSGANSDHPAPERKWRPYPITPLTRAWKETAKATAFAAKVDGR